jgi:flagellin-like hook-associated protein FlgL
LDIQNKLSSGKEFTSLAQDPVGASQVVSLNRELAQLDMYQSNIDSARRRIELEETTLDDLNSASDRMRELIIQAANDTLGDADRVAISYELEDLVSYAAGLMNTRDAKGEYLFSGSQGNIQTYVQEDGKYVYQGDSTARSIQVSSALYVKSSDAGQYLFESVDGEPGLLSTGLMQGAFEGVEITDEDEFAALMRRTGDISVGIDRYDDGLGNPNSVTYSYTLRDSAGNVVQDASDNNLQNIPYDGSSAVEVELDGAIVTLDLPVGTDYPSQTPSMEADGALRNGLSNVNVTDVDAYTNLMRAEGDLSLKVTAYNTGTGEYTYEIDGQTTNDIVTGTSTNPVNVSLAGVDLTFDLPLPEDVEGGYPSEAVLRYEPPAEGELSLRYEKPESNILNEMLATVELMRDPVKGDAEGQAALQERFR